MKQFIANMRNGFTEIVVEKKFQEILNKQKLTENGNIMLKTENKYIKVVDGVVHLLQ